MKRHRILLGVLLLLAACDDPARPVTPTQAELLHDGQIAPVGSRLADSVGIRITGANGRPARNVEVRWSTAEGAIAPTLSRTDADGVARAAWTLGTSIGDDDGRMNATASVAGLGDFVLTARARPGAVTRIELLVPEEAREIGVRRTATLGVRMEDRYGNPVTGRLPAWTSADTAVVAVNETGVVTGRRLGEARIVAALDGAADSVTVRVTRTAGGAGWMALDAGGNSVCGLTSTDGTYCWGEGGGFKLGTGTVDNASRPQAVQVPAGVRFAAVRSGNGGQLSCALAEDGAAWCWGAARTAGVGNGAEGSSPAPVAVTMPAGARFVALDASDGGACAVSAAGDVYCWGANDFGRLGDIGANVLVPTRVPVPAGVRFTSVSMAARSTCALSDGGEIYCWGLNQYGEIGTGTAGEPIPTPTRVAFGGGRARALGSGFYHHCAVMEDGGLHCWGRNQYGQIGNGATGTDALRPAAVSAPGGAYVSVAGGERHTCASTASGAVFCWGNNDRGQLGDGSSTARAAPVRAFTPAGVAIDVVTLGGRFSCGLTTEGEAYCWGFNHRGQLGIGGTTDSWTPARVALP